MASKYDGIIGRKYGRLLVLQKDGKTKNGCTQLLCQCDCGDVVDVNMYNLVYGHTKSCGCYSRDLTVNRNLNGVEDLTGKRYGRLCVKEYMGVINGRGTWKCVCDCGTEKLITKHDLDTGRVLSCGCLKDENIVKRSTKHSGCKDRLYRVWAGMKDRCYNEGNPFYRHYGGRGITVCDEWKNDYANFRECAMSNGYDSSAKHGKCTLDRIDVNENYCPENCRWVSQKVQANNKRYNLKIEYQGTIKTLSEWADYLGFTYGALYARIYECGWTIEKAFTTEVKK